MSERCYTNDVFVMLSNNIGDERLSDVFSDIGGYHIEESAFDGGITDRTNFSAAENMKTIIEHSKLRVVKVVNYDTDDVFYYSRSSDGHLVGIPA